MLFDRIRHQFDNHGSYHRRIAIGFLWVGLFVIVGKLAGAAKEMAIAWRYGVSDKVDAYVFVVNLISFPVSIWFSVLTVILLPLAARVRYLNPETLPRFRGELLGLTLATGAVLGGLAYYCLPLLLASGWAGFSGAALEQALAMAGPLSFLLPMGLTISLFSSWMMVNGHHRNTLLEALPALVILGMLLLPQSWVIEPLIWGSLAGFVLQMAGLCWALQRDGELQHPMLGFQSPVWHGFWSCFAIMVAGHAMMSGTGTIDQFFAAHLEAGAISTLSYANRIISLIVALGALTISRSILPIFSELAGQGKDSEIDEMTRQWVRFMFVLGLIVMAVAWTLAPWAVKTLFERGAFTPSNTSDVTVAFQFGSIQLPFCFAALVLTSMLASQKEYKTLAIIGILSMAVKILFNIILTPYLNINGLMISTTLMYVGSFTFLHFSVRKKLI